METENKYLILEINKVYLNHLSEVMKRQWTFILKLRVDGLVEFTMYDLKRKTYAALGIQPNVLLDDENIDFYLKYIEEAKALPEASLFELKSRKRIIGNPVIVQKTIDKKFKVQTILY